MIKVLNIITDSNIGGAGRAVLNYLSHADRDGFTPSVMLPRGAELTDRVRALGVEVIEADITPDKSFSLADMKKIKALILAEDPDIVHTHGSLTGRMAAKKAGKCTVMTKHSAFPFPGYIRKTPLKLCFKYLYQHYSDRIIAISPAGAQMLWEIGIDPERIDALMNGADPAERLPAAERSALRERFGVSDGTFLLGVLARVEEYKGHRDMADALKILLREGRDVKLLVAGTGSFEEPFRNYVEENGLSESVIMAGFRSDTAAILSCMDLQLNASYVSEASSLSLIEGMSIGLPAVVSDFCGNPYMIQNGVSGLLFRPRNPEDLAEKIRSVMDDRELYRRLTQGARDEYWEKYTGERYARNVEAVYIKALEARKNGK